MSNSAAAALALQLACLEPSGWPAPEPAPPAQHHHHHHHHTEGTRQHHYHHHEDKIPVPKPREDTMLDKFNKALHGH